MAVARSTQMIAPEVVGEWVGVCGLALHTLDMFRGFRDGTSKRDLQSSLARERGRQAGEARACVSFPWQSQGRGKLGRRLGSMTSLSTLFFSLSLLFEKNWCEAGWLVVMALSLFRNVCGMNK